MKNWPPKKTFKSKRQAVIKRVPPNNLEIATIYKAFLFSLFKSCLPSSVSYHLIAFSICELPIFLLALCLTFSVFAPQIQCRPKLCGLFNFPS
ncbi:hypothetical protein Y032_0080g1399 [Ancylostoma ceylanicum]|uniref:Uncharacterized protein n=1 Tax=Ancylostoma ceylanicum TaxID=53326 RepID=A0A016TSW1_9BILA|nr:hypothetical protein Y032_0080g1399 [Ancylostoma ceylanicum]